MAEAKANRKEVTRTLTSPNPAKTRVPVMKKAVQTAFAFAKEMIPEARGIMLEEVKPTSSGWSVVISYVTSQQSSTFAVLRGEESSRTYKKIVVESKSGQAQSLKVWK